MDLTYGTSTYDRTRGSFPSLPVINMFAESVPIEQNLILQSRPGLETSGISMGAGPVKTLYRVDGVLNNALFGISNNKLYSSSTNLGTINGTGPAKIAAFESFVFANQGQTVYQWDGAALTTVATPGGFDVTDICVGASRLVVIDKGTGQFYWSDVLTDTVDALSFATAENAPDRLKACLYVGDTLFLFGSETVEIWPVSADPTAPFQPLIGRVFPKGIRDTGCATAFNSTFAWITNHNQVCVQQPNNIISLPDLEAKLIASATASLWTFFIEGTEFLAVRLDNDTFVYSSLSQTWSKFETYEDNFIPQCCVDGYFGSSANGVLYQWSDNYLDNALPLERRFRAGQEIKSGTIPVMNLSLVTNPGQTVDAIANPTVTMRTSKDGGFAWSPWKERLLGARGNFRERIQWLSLGYFSHPGLLVEFRVTDNVDFRVSGATANDPYGGV